VIDTDLVYFVKHKPPLWEGSSSKLTDAVQLSKTWPTLNSGPGGISLARVLLPYRPRWPLWAFNQ